MESEVAVNAYISVVNYWFSIKVFSQQQVFTYCYPEIMYNVSMDEEKSLFPLYAHYNLHKIHWYIQKCGSMYIQGTKYIGQIFTIYINIQYNQQDRRQ